MAVTNYYTINGKILGEHTVGSSRLDYLPDALGSVVETLDQTQTSKSTARFKPYGADLATNGATPLYGWVGGFGYRRTGLAHSDMYLVTRHLGSSEGVFSTLDLLWPYAWPYGYVGGGPTVYIDPFGLQKQGSGAAPVCPPAQNGPVQKSPTPPTKHPHPPSWWPYPEGGDPPEPPPALPPWLLKSGLILAGTLLPTTLGTGTGPWLKWPYFDRRPLDMNRCSNLHSRYEKLCNTVAPCEGDCEQIAKALADFDNCFRLRVEYLFRCDGPGGGATVPKACDHAGAACERLTALENCLKDALNAQPPCVTVSGSKQVDLIKFRRLCNQMKAACAKQGTPFP